MDTEETWLVKKSKSKAWTFWLTLAFLLPAITGIAGRLIKKKETVGGGDFEAIACAAQRLSEGKTMYPPPQDFVCEGMQAASYVYTPWVAQGFNALTDVFSYDAMRIAYQAIFWLGLAFVIFAPIVHPKVRGHYLERAPFFGFVTGSVFYWGNIAGIGYGLVALSAYIAHRLPIVFVLCAALVGAIKPTYLPVLAVVLMLDKSLIARAGYFILGAALGLAPSLWFYLSGGEQAAEWVKILSYFGYDKSPGGGFLGWFELFGLSGRNPIVMLAFLAFGAAMVAAGFGIVERLLGQGENTGLERVWIGLAIGNLLNPRLLAYDYFLMAPGLILLIYAARSTDRTWLGAPLSKRMAQLIIGGASVMTFMNVADMGDYACQVGTLAFSIAVLVCGLPEFWPALKSRLPNAKELQNV